MGGDKLKEISVQTAFGCIAILLLALLGLSFESPRVNAIVMTLTEATALMSLLLVFSWGSATQKICAALGILLLPVALFVSPYSWFDIYDGLVLNEDISVRSTTVRANSSVRMYQYRDESGVERIVSDFKVVPGVRFSRVLLSWKG